MNKHDNLIDILAQSTRKDATLKVKNLEYTKNKRSRNVIGEIDLLMVKHPYAWIFEVKSNNYPKARHKAMRQLNRAARYVHKSDPSLKVSMIYAYGHNVDNGYELRCKNMGIYYKHGKKV